MTLILALLIGCGGGKDSATTDGDATAGAAVFAANCESCHGASGEGIGTAPALTDEVPEKSDDELKDIVQNGYEEMPAIGVTDDDWPDLLAYLRETFPS